MGWAKKRKKIKNLFEESTLYELDIILSILGEEIERRKDEHDK